MYLRSLLFYVLYISSGLAIGVLVCLISIFVPIRNRLKVASLWPRFASWCLSKICKIEIEIKGTENIPDAPFVLVSNHQSSWEAYFFTIFLFSSYHSS
jgi:1-acyl-sn-glycerol-3-phosphate acyltransferase